MATLKDLVRNTLRFLHGRRSNYLRCFSTPDGEQVLADLAKFCRANESAFNINPRLSDVLVGRREVWLRIQNHLHLTGEQLYVLSNPTHSLPQRQTDIGDDNG